MAILTDPVKKFIVQQLAMFDSPSRVAAAVREEFGIEIDRRRAFDYNPEGVHKQPVAKKWREIHAATRKAFLAEIAQIGIAHRAVRLRRLDRMSRKMEDTGNVALAAQLIEQAAKDTGGAFTNRLHHEHSGSINLSDPETRKLRLQELRAAAEGRDGP